MKVLFATPEVAPWCSTGGLGAVAAALPRHLHGLPVDGDGEPIEVSVVAPLYRAARAAVEARGEALDDTGVEAAAELAGRAWRGRFLALRGARPPIYFLDCPPLYDRDGLYVDAAQREHPDNAVRFGFFCRAALAGARALCGGAPDLVHANDWQTALAPLLLATSERARLARTGSLFTIHNLAYQGVFPGEQVPALGLDWAYFTMDGLEFHGRLNLLKGGVAFADGVTTVSPSYAQEILRPEHGFGLDGFLAAHAGKLRGILNGIELAEWCPAADPHIAARYDRGHLDGKAVCRAALLAEMGLADGGRGAGPVCGVVSRLAHQKGIDLVAELVPWLAAAGARLVVLGEGDPVLAARLRALAGRFPAALAVRLGYDVALAHRIEAGADLFIMPSRFEPCGLNQMYSMTYGTVPVVHAVGGLRDTVVDASAGADATGFTFAGATAASLRGALERALTCWRDDPAQWRRLVQSGMARDFGWDRAARAYAELYRELAEAQRERLLAGSDGSVRTV